MFSGLFKKNNKKDEASPTKTPEKSHEKPSNQDKNLTQNSTLEQSEKTFSLSKMDKPFYDLLIGFLQSPLWKAPLYSFLDEYCIIFDDEEENKLEYTDYHKKFQKLVEEILENFLSEIGLSEEKFVQLVACGVMSPNPQHKKLFEQLIVIDDFLVFKKTMVKRNKDLEIEALHEMDLTSTSQRRNLEVAQLEQEKALLDQAIAMSLKIEMEKKELMDEEDRMLEEVLKLSKLDYDQQEALLIAKQIEEIERLSRERELRESQALEELTAHKRKQEEAEKNRLNQIKLEKERLEIERLEKERLEKERVEKEALQKTQEINANNSNKSIEEVKEDKLNPTLVESSIFPLMLPEIKSSKKFEADSVSELQNHKQKIEKQLDELKKDKVKAQKEASIMGTDAESLEERRARLKAQRDALLLKKKMARDAEMKKFEEQKKNGLFQTLTVLGEIKSSTTSNSLAPVDEMAKRKEIYNNLLNNQQFNEASTNEFELTTNNSQNIRIIINFQIQAQPNLHLFDF